MRLGSLFDGSGGFPLAASMCGITPVWASEVEPYPIKVTKKNFPDMEHLGDVTKINGAEIEPVDVITFGSPCQDLSIAGSQRGLKHEEKGDDETTRSGLFMEAVRIIKEMRFATNGRYPTFAVWENVPGAYSSQGGEDFRTVLEELARVADPEVSIPRFEKWRNAGEILADGFSIAWRTLDAQYWGVPQRRKRIYLVADFRGGCAGEILFERDGLQGDSAQGKETREGVAECAERGFGAAVYDARGNGGGIVSPTITGDHNGHISDYTAICVAGFIGKNSPGAGSIGYHKGQVPTLRAGVQADVMCFDTTQITSPDNRSNPQYGSENIVCMAHGQANAEILENISPTLNCNHEQPIIDSPIVRRLTTLECCWLQGFPDRWCSIPILESFSDGEYNFWVSVRNDYNRMNGIAEKQYTKKTMIKWYNGLGTDSAQYKMWGNGIALPCALYVMQGIAELWEG